MATKEKNKLGGLIAVEPLLMNTSLIWMPQSLLGIAQLVLETPVKII